MIFRKTVSVYCENHMKHLNALYVKNGKVSFSFFNVNLGDTQSNHYALKG
jgi:hypothetical protein